MTIVSLVKFSCWSKFHLNIITGPRVMIPPSEFCPIPGDWGELWMPNLPQMCLMKCYWMLQNLRVIAFTISELLRVSQQCVCVCVCVCVLRGGGGGGTKRVLLLVISSSMKLINGYKIIARFWWQQSEAHIIE